MTENANGVKIMKTGDTVIIQEGEHVAIGVIRDTYNHGKAIKLQGFNDKDFDVANCTLVSNK
ncbi:hypothetical protein D7Z54_33805 [Salibacterium salarium]|uniref:Uncharacterized protein n=1 Tax=Salibacterium salarium TaxID=284579 RepID=A0A3R9QEQ6_9BACI|nr:hypothetical protein [Salibacterium salarium]RSL28954.1 hypothetical protein D7Z54_33805 [Salibacterium salarium]